MKNLTRWIAVILMGIASLTIVGTLMTLPESPVQSDSDWGRTATQLLNRTYEGPLPNPVPAGPPRRSGVYAGLLIAVLLTVLYAYRRRSYILDWAGSWVLLSFGLYVISRGYADVEHARLAVAALTLAKVTAAILLFRSARHFAGNSSSTAKLWLIPPAMLAWLVIAGGRLSVPVTLAPSYLLTGMIGIATALTFVSIFRKRKLAGAVLLAAAFALIGLTNFGLGLFFTRVVSSSGLLLFFLTSNGLSFLVAAFGMHLIVFEDVTRELRDMQHEISKLASTDALTGCYNRRFFEDHINRELERHRRYGMPLSLLFIDVDRLKFINDSFGHDVGDRVLQYVGDFLKRQIREADYVVRWGGDEFLVLLTCTGAEAVSKVKSFKLKLDEAVDSNALPPGLSLSIGYTDIPADASDIFPFIRLADQNMYADKIKSPDR